MKKNKKNRINLKKKNIKLKKNKKKEKFRWKYQDKNNMIKKKFYLHRVFRK